MTSVVWCGCYNNYIIGLRAYESYVLYFVLINQMMISLNIEAAKELELLTYKADSDDFYFLAHVLRVFALILMNTLVLYTILCDRLVPLPIFAS